MPWNLEQMTRGAYIWVHLVRWATPPCWMEGSSSLQLWELVSQLVTYYHSFDSWLFRESNFFLCEISRKYQVSCSFKLCKHNISLGPFFFTREVPQLWQLDGNSDLCWSQVNSIWLSRVPLWFLVKAALPTALMPVLTLLALFWLYLLFRQSLTM